jgi:glycerol-3-phosphate dehydrogenase
MKALKVAVFGGGSWGTTVAALTCRNAPVTLWARNPDTVDEINREHTQPHLPARTRACPRACARPTTSARRWRERTWS